MSIHTCDCVLLTIIQDLSCTSNPGESLLTPFALLCNACIHKKFNFKASKEINICARRRVLEFCESLYIQLKFCTLNKVELYYAFLERYIL